jgi:hypothetical protein
MALFDDSTINSRVGYPFVVQKLELVDRPCCSREPTCTFDNFRNLDMQGASGRVGIEGTTRMRDYETITSNSEDEDEINEN